MEWIILEVYGKNDKYLGYLYSNGANEEEIKQDIECIFPDWVRYNIGN